MAEDQMARAVSAIGVSGAVAVVLIAVRLWIFYSVPHPVRWLGMFLPAAFLLQMAVMAWFFMGHIAASKAVVTKAGSRKYSPRNTRGVSAS